MPTALLRRAGRKTVAIVRSNVRMLAVRCGNDIHCQSACPLRERAAPLYFCIAAAAKPAQRVWMLDEIVFPDYYLERYSISI